MYIETLYITLITLFSFISCKFKVQYYHSICKDYSKYNIFYSNSYDEIEKPLSSFDERISFFENITNLYLYQTSNYDIKHYEYSLNLENKRYRTKSLLTVGKLMNNSLTNLKNNSTCYPQKNGTDISNKCEGTDIQIKIKSTNFSRILFKEKTVVIDPSFEGGIKLPLDDFKILYKNILKNFYCQITRNNYFICVSKNEIFPLQQGDVEFFFKKPGDSEEKNSIIFSKEQYMEIIEHNNKKNYFLDSIFLSTNNLPSSYKMKFYINRENSDWIIGQEILKNYYTIYTPNRVQFYPLSFDNTDIKNCFLVNNAEKLILFLSFIFATIICVVLSICLVIFSKVQDRRYNSMVNNSERQSMRNTSDLTVQNL